jgi:toxin FitB
MSKLRKRDRANLGIARFFHQIAEQEAISYPENALDKQIAATELVYELTLVTRNVKDTGVTLLNPFE